MRVRLLSKPKPNVLLPNLSIGEDGQQPIGKYGRMRKHYLKEQHPVLYSELLLSEKLYPHLLEIDEACDGRMELLTCRLAAKIMIDVLTEGQMSQI